MSAFKKLIKEDGFVLGREIKEETQQFVSRDGTVIPAQPTRYIVHVVTSSLVDEKDGMSYISQIDFKVTAQDYEKFTYLKKVEAFFECLATDAGLTQKPVKLVLKDNK